MSYQKKYWFQFTSLDEKVNVVELWQNTTATLTATEVKSMAMPFSIELPEIDHKFQCVRGTGCEINLLSETDMQFFSGLYHTDKKEFMVKHYIDGDLNWLGYLNSEMMRESYADSSNYPVQVTGNDGFALMDRYQFLDETGAKYSGIKSEYEILGIIFDRIGLPFSELRICLSTTSSAFTIGSNETILHKSFIDCANFYDEDGVAATMRDVLEGILKPYGAFITQSGANIYVVDIHSLASDSLVYKCFSVSDWAYSDTITVTDNNKAISDIGYMGTGHEVENSGGKNKQVVSYSPYPIKSILEKSFAAVDEFHVADSLWSTRNGYQYKALANNQYFDDGNGDIPSGIYEESRADSGSDSTVYLRIAKHTTDAKITTLRDAPVFIIPKAQTPIAGEKKNIYGSSIRISGSLFLVYGDATVNPYTSEDKNQYTGAGAAVYNLQAKIKIGDKYYNGANWTTTNSPFYYKVSDKNNCIYHNSWFQFSCDIPITEDLSGDLLFEIWSFFGFTGADNTQFREAWIKELSASIININGSEIADNDIEYTSYLDSNFKDEAEKVELITGTVRQFSDRGKILYYTGSAYMPIDTWTRAGQTYRIEELLLNSLSSNFRAGYYTLTGMKLKNSFTHVNIISDTYTESRTFMPKSLKMNFRDNLIECDLIEITPDELTIEK